MHLRLATKLLASIFIASSSVAAAAPSLVRGGNDGAHENAHQDHSLIAESKNLRGLNGNGNGNGNGNSAGGNNGNGNSPDKVTVIVQLTKDKTKGPANRCHDKANANNGSVKSVYNKVFQGCAIEVNPKQVEKMKLDAEFEVVEMDQVVHASESNVQNPTWGLDRIDQCDLPLSGSTFQKLSAKNVRVYILDTGINLSHQEFEGMIGNDDGKCHWTAYEPGWGDAQGHGTHVAGTVVGKTYGVADCTAGLGCDLCSVKVLSDSGSGSTAGVIDGVEHVMNNCPQDRACVANMSLGGGFSSSLNQAVNSAVAAGITMVVAAGNDSTDACTKSPASAASAITVGSTTSTDVASSFSNYGSCVDVWAPGSGITSAWIGSNTATKSISGTSMASPHVAGVAATIQGASPTKLTPAQVQAQMEANAELLSSYQNFQRYLVTTVGGCMGPTPAPTPAPPCLTGELKVTILTDNYPAETSWTVKNTCTDTTFMSGGSYGAAATTYVSEKCLPSVGRYEFNIEDTYGDGICCGYGSGNYKVEYQGTTLAEGGEFGASETKYLIGSCDTAPPPTPNPSPQPTPPPTKNPTPPPTSAPTAPPTNTPTSPPTNPPTSPPTNSPTNQPTPNPTNAVTSPPTNEPTSVPTPLPTAAVTSPPTNVLTPSPTANPTPVPTNSDTAQPQGAVFDAVYGVPRCEFEGSSCNSLQLLDGRGSITDGTEVNASNTNKKGSACNDGNSGTHKSDESIDKIMVTAGDMDGTGSAGFITSGGKATVAVTVWCWNTGASDHLDLYLTTNVDNPVWSPLTTIDCPAGGEQILKYTFDVGQGPIQSIRANFRYNGSASSCSNGTYDDHDELMFAVKQSSVLTPPPTPAPTNEPPSGGGPQTASFDGELRVPKCAAGSSCESGALLVGRGTKGPEQNQPNTLNRSACTDGTSGTYHSDESVDKIVVRRASGGDGDLTEGDVVTIEATVWCWTTPTSDYIDFYYASSATNPQWEPVGGNIKVSNRVQCPGPGQQTVSMSYTLPAGGLQAVRVNIMYGVNKDPGVNFCVTGSFDDTDDLAFVVEPNPAGSSVTSTKNDDAQGPVVHFVRGEEEVEADNMKKKLKEMYESGEKPKNNGNGNNGNGGNGNNGNGNENGNGGGNGKGNGKIN